MKLHRPIHITVTQLVGPVAFPLWFAACLAIIIALKGNPDRMCGLLFLWTLLQCALIDLQKMRIEARQPQIRIFQPPSNGESSGEP